MLINVTVEYVTAILSGNVSTLEDYEIDGLTDFMNEVGFCHIEIVSTSKSLKTCYVSGFKTKTLELNIISK